MPEKKHEAETSTILILSFGKPKRKNVSPIASKLSLLHKMKEKRRYFQLLLGLPKTVTPGA